MKKSLLAIALAVTVAVSPVAVFADEKDDKIAELEAQVAEMQITIDNLTKELEKYTAGTSQDSYKIGETWTVPGQWSLTIDSVEETADRNEYSDKDPAAVYIVSYTYENLGYESDSMDGLYISLDSGIVDAGGSMGYSYPGDITDYAQETPVGAKCKAQECIGVDNPGDFQINFSAYDGTETEQKALFTISVQ